MQGTLCQDKDSGVLLAELPELGRINRGQVAKLVGVVPIVRDSGKKQGPRKTFAGRAMVRKVLYMAALVATRYNSRMKSFYQRLLAKGKPKKVALVAVMRKLLVTLNAMIKNNQLWSESKTRQRTNLRQPMAPFILDFKGHEDVIRRLFQKFMRQLFVGGIPA